MRDDAVLGRALPLDRGLGPEDAIYTGHVNTSLARMVTFSGAKCVNAFHYPEKAVLQWEAHTR